MNPETRQVALNVSGGLLVAATLIFMAYMVWALMNREIALNNKDIINMVLGVFLAKYSDLISFFFGSSHQNKRQTETIDHLSKAATAPSVVVEKANKANVTVEGSSDVDHRNP